MSKNIKIAIDGRPGTGKGSLAKGIAKRLNIIHIDSGAMYRAAAYYFVKNNIEINKENIEANLDNIDISITNENVVFLNGENVTDKIRTYEVSKNVSVVARIQKLREKLTVLFRKLGQSNSVVMEGRDIASVVFTDADLKIYLDVDDEIRAKRRYLDFKNAGQDVTLEEVKENLRKRDDLDLNGKFGKLIKVKDAVSLDSSYNSVDDLVDEVLSILKSRNII